MNNNELNLQDYQITESSFRFVQKSGDISDTKLKTKTTSFVKDSFRRFCKNKSSVVGAIVLGVLLLLTLFVPLFSQYDITVQSVPEQFLEPKLFSAGTGFWDGTKKYQKKTHLDGSVSAIIYDVDNQCPAEFNPKAVLNLVVDKEPSYIETVSPYGKGGYLVFENQDVTSRLPATLRSSEFLMKSTGEYKVSVSMYDEQSYYDNEQGEYRVYLLVGNEQLLLKDWSKDYSDYVLDISKALSDNGISESKGRLVFELKAGVEEERKSFVMIKSCQFSCAEEGVDISEYGFSDATAMARLAVGSDGVAPQGYWSCSGRKGIHLSEVYYCEFTYDSYEAVYGERSDIEYAASELNTFIKNGWCEYDAAVGPSSFKKLSDKCPIDEVISQELLPITNKLSKVVCRGTLYKKLGYDRMPRFIFGTDATGVDLFTRMFTGLRTSMILGVCTAAFCFLFGLIWGSVSGYFGGTVDIVMERFCEILGGVPWIVVMTLCILHFGNNFFTFFLALCLTGWMGTAARTRTQFYRFKGSEYVLASRTLGSSDMRLIFKHILPNSLGTIVTSSVLMIVSTIYSESTLSYLNLGLQGVQAFGVMLSGNQQYIQSHSYLIVFPSIVMALLMISFNLFGNGLRDALNPVLRGAED